MMDPGEIWRLLGVSPTKDSAAIRRAYANKLRAARPEDDREGFMRLRAAYESALAQAADQAEHPEHALVHMAWAADTFIRVTLPTGLGRVMPTGSEQGGGGASDNGAPEESAGGASDTGAPEESAGGTSDTGTPEESAGGAAGTPVAPQPAHVLKVAIRALIVALDQQVSEMQLRTLLGRVLELAKSGTVISQTDAARDLAVILMSYAPRSDPLFQQYMDWLQWRNLDRVLTLDPLMLTVLEHYEDVRLLLPLRSGQHPLADAFKRLSQPANPLQRWWRAHVSQQESWPELQLLQLMDEADRPHLFRELQEAEVAWWRSFAAGPVLSQTLLSIGYNLVFPLTLLTVLGGIAAGGNWRYIIPLLLALPAYMALVVVKLYLIDWPPHLVERRVAALPLAIQAGWLPVLAAVWAAVLLPKVPQVSGWGMASVGVAGCLWALYVSGPEPVFGGSRAMQAMSVNAAVAIWGIMAAGELSAPRWGVPAVAAAGAVWLLCASGLGLQALRTAWSRVAARRPKTCRGVLAACGMAVAGVLATASTPAWQPLNVWLVVSFVTIHRAALDFRWQDSKPRVIFLAVCVCLAKLVLIVTQIDMSPVITRAGGLALVAGALFNLMVTPGEPAARSRRLAAPIRTASPPEVGQ